MVMTLMEANQNSHSPKARVPKKLMTMTTKPVMVIQAALLTLSSQSAIVHQNRAKRKRNERLGRQERTVDKDGGGGQLGGKSDDPRVPIVPAKNRSVSVPNGVIHEWRGGALPHGEGHRWVNESPGERHLTTGYGEESDQLAQAQHDGDTCRGDDEVPEQKTQGATGSEGPGGSQEETSTDDASDAAKRRGRISIMEKCGGVVQRGSRDHLGMAVLQPTLEFANLLLLGGVVVGLFLVFFRHLWAGGYPR